MSIRFTIHRHHLRAGLRFAVVVVLVEQLFSFPTEKLERFPAGRVITDRQGEALCVRLGPHGEDCRPTYAAQPHHWIVQAVVATEDKRFWRHTGIDVLALLRAAKQNISNARRVSGASTISAQVVRLIDPRKRTWWSKGVEMLRARQLERQLPKIAILSHYLNRAPFGGNIVGIEAAAQRYFGKDAESLSLAQAALLAGLPQSPSRLRPDRFPAAAQKRQRHVLERMQQCGYISETQRIEAEQEPVQAQMRDYPFRAPHFAQWVDRITTARGDARPPRGTLEGEPSPRYALRTTLDASLQTIAEQTLARHVRDLAGSHGALILLEVQTGAIRAFVGSHDYFAPDSGQVNGVSASRAAGSTLKPFAYAMAFDAGFLTPGTVLADTPRTFAGLTPQNFSQTFRGAVTVRDALVDSLNIPAVDVEQRIGLPRFHGLLRELGLQTVSRPAAHYGLGLVLGNAPIRLVDIANAYACIARGGIWRPVHAVESRLAEEGGRQLFSAQAAWLISDILSGEERALDTTGHIADVHLPRMAWKTGTSAGLRDAWAIAWNTEYVIGVWVGNPDGSSGAHLVGRQTATPIAWDVFRQLYPDNQGPCFVSPGGVSQTLVCEDSGLLPTPQCVHCVPDWRIDRVSLRRTCPLPHERVTARSVPPTPSGSNGTDAAATIRITSPLANSAYRRLPDFPGLRQEIPLQAEGAPADEALHWFVNDRPFGVSTSTAPLYWSIQRGTHTIVCLTPSGKTACTQIHVE